MRNKSCEDEGVKTAFSSEGASVRGNGNVTTGSWPWWSESVRKNHVWESQINRVSDKRDDKRYALNKILEMIIGEEMLQGQNKKVSKQAQCVGKSEMVITANCSVTSFVTDR